MAQGPKPRFTFIGSASSELSIIQRFFFARVIATYRNFNCRSDHRGQNLINLRQRDLPPNKYSHGVFRRTPELCCRNPPVQRRSKPTAIGST